MSSGPFPSSPVSVRTCCDTDGAVDPAERRLIGEAALALFVEGHRWDWLLCTPGDAPALAAGFCLSEGLIEAAEDLQAVEADDLRGEVHVTLAPRRRPQAGQGWPGGAPVSPERRLGLLTALDEGPRLAPSGVRARLEGLDGLQPLRAQTRAAHAAALYDQRFALLAVAEDVGRHNALDKAVGRLLLDGGLERAALLVLSSRISFEMVSKAARARVPVVAAISRPTDLAVAVGRRLNMTLANPHGADGLCVYCGAERLGMGDGKTESRVSSD